MCIWIGALGPGPQLENKIMATYIGKETRNEILTIQLTRYNTIVYDLSEDPSIPEGWMNLGSFPITIEIPEVSRGEITTARVAGLNDVKDRLETEHLAKVNHIEECIKSLLALEYIPTADDDHPVDKYADDPLAHGESAAL